MDDLGLISVMVLIIGLGLFGAYRTGRALERRAYTKAFVAEVEASYWQGFDDGRRPVSHGR